MNFAPRHVATTRSTGARKEKRKREYKFPEQESVPHGSLIEPWGSLLRKERRYKLVDSGFYCVVSWIASGVKFHLDVPAGSGRRYRAIHRLRGFHGFLRAARHT